jgi:hypothetical protein
MNTVRWKPAWILSLLVLACGACGGRGGGNMTAELDALKARKASIAVVSLSVTDYGGSLQWTSSSDVAGLIQEKMNGMLAFAEGRFAGSWTVLPAAEFLAMDAYHAASIGRVFEGRTPFVGRQMPHFVENRGDLVRANLPPEKAVALGAALGADALAVVYSEWTIATGGFVPTSKPLTKNVLSIWDNQGRRLFHGRKDVVGEKTLGAMGRVMVDQNTVDEWILAYEKGLDEVLAGI